MTRGPAPTVDMRYDKNTWFYATDIISASTQNALWRKEEQTTMEDHSSALPVKDRFSAKASKISWKIGHCMPISGMAPFQKMRKKETKFEDMRKSQPGQTTSLLPQIREANPYR